MIPNLPVRWNPEAAVKVTSTLFEISEITILKTWLQRALVGCSHDCRESRVWKRKSRKRDLIVNEEGQVLYVRISVSKKRQKKEYLDSVSTSVNQDSSNSVVGTHSQRTASLGGKCSGHGVESLALTGLQMPFWMVFDVVFIKMLFHSHRGHGEGDCKDFEWDGKC